MKKHSFSKAFWKTHVRLSLDAMILKALDKMSRKVQQNLGCWFQTHSPLKKPKEKKNPSVELKS